MYNYDYRPYFNSLITNTDNLESVLDSLSSKVDTLYTILGVILAVAVGILAYLMIKNWRFKKK